MIRVATLLLLIVAIVLLNNAAPFAQSKTVVSPEEYAVYDAAIAKIFAQRPVNQLRIISPTVDLAESLTELGGVAAANEEDIKSWMSRFQNIKRQTIEDYLDNCKQKTVLKRSFKHGFKYVIWENAAPLKFGETPKTDKQWLDDDCYLQLSRVGFDREHEQAILYMSYSYGAHRAEGFFVFVAKTDNQWSVAKVDRAWVS
jgi:hypothetical protein